MSAEITPAELIANLVAALGLEAAAADDAQCEAMSEASANYYAGRAGGLRRARDLALAAAELVAEQPHTPGRA